MTWLYFNMTLDFSVEQVAVSCCPALCLIGHPPLLLSLSLKSSAEQTLHDWWRRPTFLWDQPCGNLWGKKADASCCYLRMRDSIGWNDTLDDGLREDIGFSSGTQFLEGMTDVHLCSSLLSILARLWPCSCHTVDTACETATLKLHTGLNGPSLSCLCFLTEVNLSAHRKLLPETLADRTTEKLPFVCLCFRLCSKSPIVRGYF